MNKYTALRFISALLKFFGWCVFVLGAITFVIGFVSLAGMSHESDAISLGFSGAGGIMGVTIGVSVMIFGLISVAFGEIIRVFMDIEANTRLVAKDTSAVDKESSENKRMVAPASSPLDPFALARKGEAFLREALNALTVDQLVAVATECGMNEKGWAHNWGRPAIIRHIVYEAMLRVRDAGNT